MIRNYTAGLLFSLVLSACALQPKNIASHRIVGADDADLDAVTDVRFGVLGNTRTAIPMLDSGKDATRQEKASGQIIGDLMWQSQQGALDFVVLLGDMVRFSRDSEWSSFDAQWRDLIDGVSVPEMEGRRIPVLPVVGDREAVLDERLQGFGGAFPGVGANIGFNRVASWYKFDQRIGNSKWRFLVVDTNKDGMGSRWREQLFWLPQAASGDYDHLIVFMHDSRITLATDGEMNPDGVPQELIEMIEQHAGLMKLRVVFSAGGHSSEIYLPEGRLGTAYVGAGGGGPKAATLRRWGDGARAGMEAIQLEPRFDIALQGALTKREGLSQSVMDEARAEGDWDGFIGRYNSKHFPLSGYWLVDIQDEGLRLGFRLVGATGALEEIYSLTYRAKEGWSSSSQ